jgi:hypothetical protein
VYTSSVLRGAPYTFYKISFTKQKKKIVFFFLIKGPKWVNTGAGKEAAVGFKLKAVLALFHLISNQISL